MASATGIASAIQPTTRAITRSVMLVVYRPTLGAPGETAPRRLSQCAVPSGQTTAFTVRHRMRMSTVSDQFST